MTKRFKDLKKELKQKDPELYDEIMTEATQEIEEIKKQWGGVRPGAGRKKVYANKVKETFEVEQELSNLLKEYAKEHRISKNKAINEAIKKLLKAS